MKKYIENEYTELYLRGKVEKMSLTSLIKLIDSGEFKKKLKEIKAK